jgi:hypothetical protein
MVPAGLSKPPGSAPGAPFSPEVRRRTGRPGVVCCIRNVMTFAVTTNEYLGDGSDKAEHQYKGKV